MVNVNKDELDGFEATKVHAALNQFEATAICGKAHISLLLNLLK